MIHKMRTRIISSSLTLKAGRKKCFLIRLHATVTQLPVLFICLTCGDVETTLSDKFKRKYCFVVDSDADYILQGSTSVQAEFLRHLLLHVLRTAGDSRDSIDSECSGAHEKEFIRHDSISTIYQNDLSHFVLVPT